MSEPCAQHEALIHELTENNKLTRELIALLLGDAKGSTGIVERMRTSEKWIAAMEKLRLPERVSNNEKWVWAIQRLVWASVLSAVAIVVGFLLKGKLGF